MTCRNTKAEFDRLLCIRNKHPEKAAEMDAEICAVFTETHAIMVLDTAGFSRLTIRYGIIHFLAALQQLCAIASPFVGQHGGMVVKQEADNLFAVFPDVEPAVNAAVDILEALASFNVEHADMFDLYASIGIGYGEVLMIENKDLFGHEMNLASKLGEDLARSSEILLTEAAFSRANARERSWEKLELSISGVELVAYKVIVPALLI